MECEKCQDRGIIRKEKNGEEYYIECDCVKLKLIKKQLERAGLNKQYTFNDFKIDVYPKEDRTYMESIKEAAKAFIKSTKTTSLNMFFTGNVGTGKTLLMKIIISELFAQNNLVRYEKLGLLLDRLMYLKVEDQEEYFEELDKLYHINFLALDDLGTEKLSESKILELYNLIDERLNNEKSTIISSNLSLEEIKEEYNERISSRLKEYITTTFKGEDLRGKTK